jgi:phospholipase A1
MRRRTTRYGSWAGAASLLIGLWLVLVLLNMASAETLSETSLNMAECAKIEDDAERLKCYDKLAGQKSRNIEPVKESAEKAPEEKGEKPSYLSRLWELDEETRSEGFAISPYRSNYILAFTYNKSPNVAVIQEAHPEDDVKKFEVDFQLSLKIKLLQDILDQNYEPELLLNFRTDYSILGLRGRFINVGFNHQSNGKSQPLSRSWNRAVLNFGFERGPFSLLLNGWYRIPESARHDDNPKIEKYLGYGEIWAYYFLKNNRFGIMFRNNLSFHNNRGALQAEWSFPLLKRVSGYVQYFRGYGESLLDYDHSMNRIGIGFILSDWN